MFKFQINCILGETQHQFNSPKNCISVTYCTELDLVYLQTNYFAKGHRFPPRLQMRTRFPKKRADLGAVSNHWAPFQLRGYSKIQLLRKSVPPFNHLFVHPDNHASLKITCNVYPFFLFLWIFLANENVLF